MVVVNSFLVLPWRCVGRDGGGDVMCSHHLIVVCGVVVLVGCGVEVKLVVLCFEPTAGVRRRRRRRRSNGAESEELK